MCSRVFGREQLQHPKGVTPGFAKKPGLTELSLIISRIDAAFKIMFAITHSKHLKLKYSKITLSLFQTLMKYDNKSL